VPIRATRDPGIAGIIFSITAALATGVNLPRPFFGFLFQKIHQQEKGENQSCGSHH
jgi:hypothetical protein